MDPFTFNLLGHIRQQEILEQAEYYRDVVPIWERLWASLRGRVSAWRALSQRNSLEMSAQPEPVGAADMICETC
jgi:hypothetical protein